MRHFRIITLSVSGRGKRILESGQVVTENDLPADPDRISELIKGKYIEEVDAPKSVKKEPESNDNGGGPGNPPGGNDEKKAFDDITVKDLRTELLTKGIDFNSNAPKAELYELYKNS